MVTESGMMCTGTAKMSDEVRIDVMNSQISGKTVTRIVTARTA